MFFYFNIVWSTVVAVNITYPTKNNEAYHSLTLQEEPIMRNIIQQVHKIPRSFHYKFAPTHIY